MHAFSDLAPWERTPTPFLALDGARLRRNLARVQAFCDGQGIVLRPHAKTHKLQQIARAQVEGGATGLTVASLGEAEDFAEAGFDDLFLASSLVGTPESARRVRDLVERVRLRIAADSIAGVEALHRAGLHRFPQLTLLLEVDCGLHRSGVEPTAIGPIARRAADLGFVVDGVFTYPGHGYGLDAQGAAARDEVEALATGAAALVAEGISCAIRSGGSTPTLFHSRAEGLTEIRPGVYPLNDAQQVALGSAGIDDVAIAAVTTVVSVPEAGRLVLDAGSKTIASDRPAFVDGHGIVLGLQGAVISRIWEHHAVVELPDHATYAAPRVGDRLAVVPNHVCTALNLADRVMVLSDGEVESWELIARGRNG